MNSGIYMILNKTTNKYYIGSAININKRWNMHKSKLNNNNHHSIYLQNAWNLYGQSDFQFYVLEDCSIQKLIEREQYWLDKSKCYNQQIGYNLCKIAGSPIGLKRSDETRLKISNIKKGIPKTLQHIEIMRNQQLGKIHSQETKLKISKSNMGHLVSLDTKQKISLIKMGHVVSNNIRNKISESQKLRWKKIKIDAKYNLWPHEKGARCKCKECKEKRNDNLRIWRLERKLCG